MDWVKLDGSVDDADVELKDLKEVCCKGWVEIDGFVEMIEKGGDVSCEGCVETEVSGCRVYG